LLLLYRRFSLIELLIVFSIFGILISLLQPSLKSIISSSGFIGCSNNLKQIGGGHFLYMEDYDYYFSSTYYANSLISRYYRAEKPGTRNGISMRFNQNPEGYLEPYLGEKGNKVYQCPDFDIDQESNFYNLIKNNGKSTYRGFRNGNFPITKLSNFNLSRNFSPIQNKSYLPITWDFTSQSGSYHYDIGQSKVHGNSGELSILFSDGHTKVCFFPVDQWKYYEWGYDSSIFLQWYD